MKTTRLSILLLLFTMTSWLAQGATVAKVDFNEIDDLLTQVVLNAEGNESLRERYLAKKQTAEEAQEKLQAAMMRGEAINPREAAALGLRHNDADKKKVEQLCQKHLLEIIERAFTGKYEIIFKDEYRSSLLYTKGAIDDVTMVVKQELLKSLPTN